MRASGRLCVKRSDLAETGAENSPLAPLCCIISDTKEIERTHEMVMRYPSLPTIISLRYCSGPKWVKGWLLEIQKMDTENNNPYQTSVSTNPPALPRKGHSKLGIASFVTAIVGGLSFFILCVSLGHMEMNTPRGVDETSKAFILMRNGVFLALFILLLSLSLGIAGFFQKERKRIFSILGFNFSFLILFSVFLFSLSLF